jgi:hypothetical protein
VLHSVDEPGAATAPESRERLVAVFSDDVATRVDRDRLAALVQLVGDRATLVLGALGGVEDAWDRCVCVDLLRLSV